MTADTDTHQDELPAEAEDAEVDASPTSPEDPSEAAGDAEAAKAATDAEEPVPETIKIGPADPEDRIKQLELEKIRIAADFANYQKRVNRDRAKWSQEAVRDLLSSMLTVLDNLDHSISAFDGDVKDPSVYRQGVELVQTELLHVLKNYGLLPVEAADGTPFDPDQHQAISVQPADDIEQEQVAFVARKGYMLGDVVLRPAQVVVKKPS